MRSKGEILRDLGLTDEYYAHGGIKGDVKDIVLTEVLIDIRDVLVTDAKDALNALIEIRKTH